MFDAGWKPSGSLLEVEHELCTIEDTIPVSCVCLVMCIIYILSTIRKLCIVHKQERGLFLLIFSQYFNDFPKGVQLSTGFLLLDGLIKIKQINLHRTQTSQLFRLFHHCLH